MAESHVRELWIWQHNLTSIDDVGVSDVQMITHDNLVLTVISLSMHWTSK